MGWKYCAQPLNARGKILPCGNRVLRFVDQQPDDQCWSCYQKTEKPGPDTGHGYQDKNDGGVPE